MTNIKRLFLVLTLFALIAFKGPEEPVFVVYATKGTITKITGGKIVKLTKGQKLYKEDILNLVTGTKITLVCANYNKLDLTKAGKFKVKELSRACESNKNSFTAAYFKFVWDEFTHPHKSVEAKPEHYMKTAGAVTRGKEPVILSLPADTIKYYAGGMRLNYLPAKDTLTIHFYNVSSTRIIKSAKVSGNIPIGALAAGLGKNAVYEWKLFDKQRRSGPAHILILMPEEKYKTEVDQVLQQVVVSDAAEAAFMKAFLLEHNHFLAEAGVYYKTAMKLNPANATYKQFANRFM